MQRAGMRSIVRVLIIACTAGLLLLGVVGRSPAQAEVFAEKSPAPVASAWEMQFDEPIGVTVVFTNPASLSPVTDLGGNPLGEGVHIGGVRCNQKTCAKSTRLFFMDAIYTYRFSTRQASDPIDRRVVVAGRGVIDGPDKKRFSFTATFEDNGDGTIAVWYVASDPQASFAVPSSPGTMVFHNR